MQSDRQQHWDRVYTQNTPTEVSWYQAEATPSLQALDRFEAPASSPLIDIGGGASTLVDALLARGWRDLTVLDIAEPAMKASRRRLGSLAEKVEWIVADVTRWQPPRSFQVWHDRAVFHFLTHPEQRDAYRSALLAGVAPGGLVIIATFALEGPDKCSGLPVQRYDAHGLAAELGGEFTLIEYWQEVHVTPWETRQSFTWCAFRRQDCSLI